MYDELNFLICLAVESHWCVLCRVCSPVNRMDESNETRSLSRIDMTRRHAYMYGNGHVCTAIRMKRAL